MILKRTDDFFEFFKVNDTDRRLGMKEAAIAGERAKGMTDTKDYEALAATIMHYKPKRIFEIGTYLGITSDFVLSLLPESEVVSIAYINPWSKLFGKFYNNSELTRDQIGSEVAVNRRTRFTQLYGNTHKLNGKSFVKKYGNFDLVFIDGDHSFKGVAQDTEFVKNIITASGVICWHDANPKPKYKDVRLFLEKELSLPAIATKDEYIGGIAAWSKEIENKS